MGYKVLNSQTHSRISIGNNANINSLRITCKYNINTFSKLTSKFCEVGKVIFQKATETSADEQIH